MQCPLTILGAPGQLVLLSSVGLDRVAIFNVVSAQFCWVDAPSSCLGEGM